FLRRKAQSGAAAHALQNASVEWSRKLRPRYGVRRCSAAFISKSSLYHMSPFVIIALVLILARAIAELWLSRLNERHVRAHANEVPSAFRRIIDNATYRRSVDYTLAKSRFGDVVTVFDSGL